MIVFLIGYRGTGKTTVAEILAARYQCEWVDADVEIEQRAGKTIADIFKTAGEAGFRKIEAEVVRELANTDHRIVALGGGAVLSEENRNAIQGRGLVIWLQASPDTIASRISEDRSTKCMRPQLTTLGGAAEIRQLLDQRTPIYRDCADCEIDTENKTPHQVAEQIAASIMDQ